MEHTDDRHPTHKTFVEPCGCGGCTLLVIDAFDDDDLDEFCGSLFQRPRHDGPRWRISAAWKTLRGQPIYGPEMILSEPGARRLRDWLSVRLGDEHRTEGLDGLLAELEREFG